MSVASMVAGMPLVLYHFRPARTVGTDGRPVLTYALLGRRVCTSQPIGQTGDFAQDRENSRTATTLYFDGRVEVRIDDEFREDEDGSGRVLRVTGATVPAENAPARLSHTICAAVDVSPEGA